MFHKIAILLSLIIGFFGIGTSPTQTTASAPISDGYVYHQLDLEVYVDSDGMVHGQIRGHYIEGKPASLEGIVISFTNMSGSATTDEKGEYSFYPQVETSTTRDRSVLINGKKCNGGEAVLFIEKDILEEIGFHDFDCFFPE